MSKSERFEWSRVRSAAELALRGFTKVASITGHKAHSGQS